MKPSSALSQSAASLLLVDVAGGKHINAQVVAAFQRQGGRLMRWRAKESRGNKQ